MIKIFVPSLSGHRKGYLDILIKGCDDRQIEIVDISEIWQGRSINRLSLRILKLHSTILVFRTILTSETKTTKIIILDGNFFYWLPIHILSYLYNANTIVLDFRNSFRSPTLRFYWKCFSRVFKNTKVLTTNIDYLDSKINDRTSISYLPDFFTSAKSFRVSISDVPITQRHGTRIGLAGLSLERKGVHQLLKLNQKYPNYVAIIENGYKSDHDLNEFIDKVDLWWVGYPKWKQGISFIHLAMMKAKPIIGLSETYAETIIKKYKVGFVLSQDNQLHDYFDGESFDESRKQYLEHNSPAQLLNDMRFWSNSNE